MQYPRIAVLSETNVFARQTKHHRGQKTNKPTSRTSAKTIFSTPHSPITELPHLLPTEPNAFSPPKRIHPLKLPKSQNLIPKRRGINTKIYSRMKRIYVNIPSTASQPHLLSAKRSISRFTSARSASRPPRLVKTRTWIRQNRKPWCSC